jgi:copper ion binding protein
MIHHEDSQRSAAQQATLQVTGMTCASCVAHVERALRELPGVSQAIANLATGTAKVEFDPSQVSLEQMAQAVREVGYEAAPYRRGQGGRRSRARGPPARDKAPRVLSGVRSRR